MAKAGSFQSIVLDVVRYGVCVFSFQDVNARSPLCALLTLIHVGEREATTTPSAPPPSLQIL